MVYPRMQTYICSHYNAEVQTYFYATFKIAHMGSTSAGRQSLCLNIFFFGGGGGVLANFNKGQR